MADEAKNGTVEVASAAKKLKVTPSAESMDATSRSVIEDRLSELNIELPPPGTPKGSYAMVVRSGNLIYTSGHIPSRIDGTLVTGKVGVDVTVEDAAAAAELCALHIISSLKAELGNLDRIKRIVKLVGFVNSEKDFGQQPTVVNGASDLLKKIFGPKGIHARSAVGSSSLPLNVSVEIETIIEVSEED